MEWEGREQSTNVEDRRGFGGKKAGLAIGGGAGLLITIVALVLGVDPSMLGLGGRPDTPQEFSAEEQKMAEFSGVILKDTEIVWDEQFAQLKPGSNYPHPKVAREYEHPHLVLYTDETSTACGEGSAAIGPFYCPGDQKVYIDLGFFVELDKKLGAPGEFARAYVIAHEVGHHVQNLLGYSDLLNKARGKQNFNEMSVRMELQADYLAGVWAHHAQRKFKYLDKGDIASAMNAANQIGDDRLMKKAGRPVVPEKFTHGRSDQRVRWFKKGFETGDLNGAAALFKMDYKDL